MTALRTGSRWIHRSAHQTEAECFLGRYDDPRRRGELLEPIHELTRFELDEFDKERKLVYRGQFDDSRPKSAVPVSGRDLREAAEALLAGQPIAAEQRPSVGCNIKWAKGNEPDYFASASARTAGR